MMVAYEHFQNLYSRQEGHGEVPVAMQILQAPEHEYERTPKGEESEFEYDPTTGQEVNPIPSEQDLAPKTSAFIDIAQEAISKDSKGALLVGSLVDRTDS